MIHINMNMQAHPSSSEISNHWIQILFPFDFAVNQAPRQPHKIFQLLQNLTLAQGLANMPLPEQTKNKLEKKADEKMWINRALTMKDALLPPLQQILQGKTGGYAMLQLSHSALQLCNGDKPKSKPSLVVKLGGSAQKRLGDGTQQLNFSLLDIHCLMLDLGVGCITLKLQFSSLTSAAQLVEGLYELCRNQLNGQTASISWLDGTADEIKGLAGLLTAIAPIFGEGLANPSYGMWRKNFSYTAVAIHANRVDQLKQQQLAYRIAKKYTDAYLPNDAMLPDTIYQPFNNITHICTLEGGAVMVELNGNEVIDQFLNDSAKTIYFPICLIAFMEYLALVTLSNVESRAINFISPNKQDWEHLHAIRIIMYHLRLNYRFSQVSHITMHNEVHHHWREAFTTPALLEEISADIAEIEHFVTDHRQQQTQKSIHDLELLVFLGGSLMAIKEFFGIELYRHLFGNVAPDAIINGSLVLVTLVVGYLMISRQRG